MSETLYLRLGGYDAIIAVTDDLLRRPKADPKLECFWKNRGKDGMHREQQLLVDFLCASAGGPLYYTGRVGHLEATLDKFQAPTVERGQVLAFVDSTKRDIVG